MNFDNVLIIVAVFAVLVSAIGAGFTYSAINNFKNTWVTGFVSSGQANLTIESAVSINFSNAIINWSSGRINGGQTRAQLLTTHKGSVTNGNWTAQEGFILENIGNVNVTLDLKTNKNSTTLFGGTNPGYQWNVTANGTAADVGGTCGNTTTLLNGGHELGYFYPVNTSGMRFCATFNFNTGLDILRIDFNMTIPEDATTGDLGDVVTATIAAA
ncbi:hypothetical protein AUJ84_04275 [Candidatus Pacearchaeota archaeon CG1_02_32_132]|nr:MAG: hypothetical protein AUJ84_04275 [Candidatus Pacearchaeota archaeon CG1_02_32_132]